MDLIIIIVYSIKLKHFVNSIVNFIIKTNNKYLEKNNSWISNYKHKLIQCKQFSYVVLYRKLNLNPIGSPCLCNYNILSDHTFNFTHFLQWYIYIITNFIPPIERSVSGSILCTYSIFIWVFVVHDELSYLFFVVQFFLWKCPSILTFFL